MNQHIKSVFIILISMILGAQLQGQDTLQKPFYQITLLTIAPGSEIYSLFGHSAIRVKNIKTGEDNTYNYGTFDFNTPHFMIKFLRGKLPYQLSKAPIDLFIYEYQQTKRSVTEQTLDISPDEADRIVAFLENNALPENKEYRYDFLYDNCSTRVRDVFNNELNLRIEEEFTDNKTFRDMLHEYLVAFPWTRFGIDLIVASRADKATDFQSQMFLPDYLQAHMAKSIQGEASDKKYAFMPVRQLLFFDTSEVVPPVFSPFNTFLGIAVLLILMSFTRFGDVVYNILTLVFVLLGIGSMILIFMWFATDHYTTKMNYNVIWMSPMYILLPFVPRKGNMVLSGLLILLTILCLIQIFPQMMPVREIATLIITSLGLNMYFHYKNSVQDKAFTE